MSSEGRIVEEDLLWVRWNAAAHQRRPEIADAIARFDPGPREPGQAAAAWLREHGLGGESQPYLALFEQELVGFYALTAGQVELASGARDKLGLARSTQGAYLLTWVAKSAQHDFDGAILVNDAVGVAQELAEGASATLLALDPYDEETDQMWRTRFGMRPSRTTLRVSGSNGPLKRLFVPLRQP
jgi:hypothetical protein